MKNNESTENYLKTIFTLSHKLPVVRSIDVAIDRDVSKPSVSVAMKHLREKEYISVSDSGFISLTESGLEIAKRIYNRHETISRWLESLGVPEKIAADDACSMEHILSKETYAALKKHIAETTDITEFDEE